MKRPRVKILRKIKKKVFSVVKNRLLINAVCVAMLCSVSFAENVQSEPENKTTPKTLTPPASQVTVKRHVELLDFLQKAYDTNPQLLSARYGRNAQEAEMLGVMSLFGPNVRLTATAEHDRAKGYGKNFSEQLESFRDTEYDVKGGIAANINLFRCGSDTFAMMAGAAKQDVYDVEQAAAIQKFIITAVEAYVDVKKRRQELDVYTKFERQARHNFERVQTEYVVGSSTRTNVLTAKAELAEATSKRVKAQTELINAEQAYIAMSGEPAGELVYPTNTLKLPASLEEAMKIAEERSLTLRKSAANLRAARHGLASAVTGTLPSVDLYAQYDTPLKSEDINQTGNGQVGIRFTYELFSNSGQGSHLSKIKKATHEKQAANYGHEHARSDMIKEVKAGWHGLKTAEIQRSQAELAVEAARNAYEGAVEEFRLGQRAYLDLLKVQEQLLKAELNYLEAVKAEILGRYKLLAATGGLTPSAVGLMLNERDEEV